MATNTPSHPEATAHPDLTVTAPVREPFLAWITGRYTDRQAITAGLSATGGTRGLRRLRTMYPLDREPQPAWRWTAQSD